MHEFCWRLEQIGDGYFNNEMFLTQVKEAIDVFEVLKLKVVL